MRKEYYVRLKNGEKYYFSTELDMYKFLWEGVYNSNVICYGKVEP